MLSPSSSSGQTMTTTGALFQGARCGLGWRFASTSIIHSTRNLMAVSIGGAVRQQGARGASCAAPKGTKLHVEWLGRHGSRGAT